ncbi:uroporphyrinogen-III synthase [Halobacillus salinus]|uniref:uroporphyrinogen-III synthase n=1 Tax=Halobacillus salinus TaxID=192814 RepID=UPI0009A7FD36|nr:uroporphyrinogen-III synthase [Halobacillus salinus]
MSSLTGRTVLVTRGKTQAASMVHAIERQGGNVIHTPLVTFQVNNTRENQRILIQLHDYDWVFFTSSNGVKFFFTILNDINIEVPVNLRFAVVGEKTERTLEKYGYQADFVPSSFKGSKMGKEFFERFEPSMSILYVRGNRSKDDLIDNFKEQQVFFQTITAYDTLLVKNDKHKIEKLVENGEIDALTFTSPSTVEAFSEMIEIDDVCSIPCFCIGPTTASEAEAAGFRHIFIPESYTIDHMVDSLSQYFQEGER